MTFEFDSNVSPLFSLPVTFEIEVTKDKPTDCEIIDVGLNNFYIIIIILAGTQVVGKFAIS
jgi:hypothetical protein